MKGKVVVGMSGGVDSSVAAWLLKEQGYEVIGATMVVWETKTPAGTEENGGRRAPDGVEDARRVAQVLGIPHYVIDFKREFKEKVVDHFVSEYLSGRTPNPCIACNRYVKWEALLSKSLALGADHIATGHYAKIGRLKNGRFAVGSSDEGGKDQSYALYGLTQFQLAHTLMPLGGHTKEDIRKIASENDLPVAFKPDSQDICFVPDGDHGGFIAAEAPERDPGPGNFVTEDGRVLGTHKGITHYTIGQRKGLGLSVGHPVFVSKIRPDTNEVVVSDSDVFSSHLVCDRINFMGMEGLHEPRRLWAKVRYAHKGEWCQVERFGEDKLYVGFEKPVRAITPGQAVVFYEEGYVMGGGVIM